MGQCEEQTRVIQKWAVVFLLSFIICSDRISVFENGPAIFIWEGIPSSLSLSLFHILNRTSSRSSQNFSWSFYILCSSNSAADDECMAAGSFLSPPSLLLLSQWLWLNNLLKPTEYTFWGPRVFFDLIRGYDWQVSTYFIIHYCIRIVEVTGHFPRIVHCDFQRRGLASVQVSNWSFRPHISPL